MTALSSYSSATERLPTAVRRSMIICKNLHAYVTCTNLQPMARMQHRLSVAWTVFPTHGAINAHIKFLRASTAVQIASPHLLSTFSAKERCALNWSENSWTIRPNGVWSAIASVPDFQPPLHGDDKSSAYQPTHRSLIISCLL
jgi:hypothetical protein